MWRENIFFHSFVGSKQRHRFRLLRYMTFFVVCIKEIEIDFSIQQEIYVDKENNFCTVKKNTTKRNNNAIL